jgi:TolB-like protein/cytochrome c-type biogenesis protein CcmH/NrfG
MNGFFEELKRRKVYRVAIAYIVASWALAQGLAQVLPVFEISNSVIRVVIALLLFGFPVALVLAWVFDITPTGIKRTASAAASPAVPVTHRRRNLFMLAAAGVVISAAVGFFVLPHAVARKVDKSIAVLPFENLSDEKENAYFADGVQDDILTNLSKIGDLKVISRTSVMGYRGRTSNLREIGKALGVSAILEGSVRRSGNRVRVNVQLIDANNDEHLWASDYDRDLTDVFAIQTDLAEKISEALKARLSPSEKASMEQKPTQNNEAYLAFIRAHDLWSSSYEDVEKLKQGEQLYQTAIDLDPKFALAYARFSQLESWFFHSFEATPARGQKARDLAKRALELQPDLPEAHLALGQVYYYVDNDFDTAAREFQIAQSGLPNESEVYLALGAIQRRQGKWQESNASFEKAVNLNPKDVWTMQNLAINYENERDFDSANKVLDRALAADPTAFGCWETRAKVALEQKGDLSVADNILAKADGMRLTPEVRGKLATGRASLFLLRRQFDAAVREAEKVPDGTLAAYPGSICGKYSAIGAAKHALHDEAGAREAFLKAKQDAEQLVKQNPGQANAIASLAEVQAWLGEKDAALAGIKQAREILPETKDAFGGMDITQMAAEIYTILGDTDKALATLDGMLQKPSSMTVQVLKVNPMWDPLRKDPRFQAMLDKYGAKA